MRLVIQRVSRASVTVNDEVAAAIGGGLLLLVAVAPGDTMADVDGAVEKVAGLRIFADSDGLMNLSILEVGGSALVVSQFTLLADLRRGRRPSFVGAADPGPAAALLEQFVDRMRSRGIPTETGAFGRHMVVDIVNDGPVTIVMEVRGGQVL
ncbi:MAG TPA: D-aminoacyl-tRNA deacylase [Acidimicrobiia bacterium]|jgi:D-tyrosyl-tRNA(Tyr) deacylase